jgi:hypothetical protein
VVSSEVGNNFGPFLAFFACSGRFGKNGDFLAAQPPKRSFDRPVRWYLRYLRARDVQSATLPLVYVTSGGSNLPVRPKKRPRVPAGPFQNGSFSTPGARFLAFGYVFRTHGHIPIGRFFGWTQTAELHGDCPPKQQICPQNKQKIARRNRTNDHQTATTDNHGQ